MEYVYIMMYIITLIVLIVTIKNNASPSKALALFY